MYGRFVGLDFGKNEVRLCLVKRGFRELQLLQTLRVPVTEDVSSALSKAFTENSLPKGDVAASVSEGPISVRVISFPFTDPKKIDQVYEFELEGVSTFDPGEKIHGYHLVKSEGGSEALVAVYEKESIKNVLDICEGGGLDPKVVTYTPFAFSSLNDELVGERPLLLVNMDESGLSFSLFDDAGLKRVRSSSLDVSGLLDPSSGGSDVDSDSSYAALQEGLGPLVAEVRRTVQFFETELRQEIKSILVSGSIALVPGVVDNLGSGLGREVKKLYIQDLGVDNSCVHGKSYALALYGSSIASGKLNYRKDEFKYEGRDSELRKLFLTPAILLVLLLCVLLYRSTSSYFELRSEVNQTQAQIDEIVRETFPEIKVIPRPQQFMESEVAKVRNKLRTIEGVEGGPTPLDVLRDISLSIPKSMNLTLDEVKFENDKTVKIKGRCGSYQDVAKIEKALSGSGKFERVALNQTGNAVNNSTKFEMSLVLKTSV